MSSIIVKLSIEDLENILYSYPEFIKYIENPSLEIQMIALNKDVDITHIQNPHPNFISQYLRALDYDYFDTAYENITNDLSKYLNPSERFVGIEDIPDELKKHKNPSTVLQVHSVTYNYKALKYINDQTADIIMIAYNNNPKSFKYIKFTESILRDIINNEEYLYNFDEFLDDYRIRYDDKYNIDELLASVGLIEWMKTTPTLFQCIYAVTKHNQNYSYILRKVKKFHPDKVTEFTEQIRALSS